MSRINRRQNFATRLARAPKDQYKVLFETTPVALVEGFWGTCFKVHHVNQAAMELFAADSPDQFSRGFDGLLKKINPETLLELLSSRVKGDLFEAELRMPDFRRGHVYVFMRLVHMPARHPDEPPHALLAFHDITAYKKRENFFMRLSQLDGLTQVYNQRTILRRLDDELARAKRYDLQLACVILDVDNFKSINDQMGHLAGDKALKSAAHMLKKCVRQTDVVGRYGGDEFMVILPETTRIQAIVPVSRFLKAYGPEGKISNKDKDMTCTFSVGISGYAAGQLETARGLIEGADKALYESKTSGGNCYHIYGPAS